LLLGGVGGAALYGAIRPPTVQIVYVDRPLLVGTAAQSAEPSLEPAPAPTWSPTVSRLSAKPANSSLRDRGSELARERALLDLARKSAVRSDAAQALVLAEQHRAEFPHGHLAEEREAMAIRALSALGRSDEARERTQAFHAAYPNSFLAGVVDSAVPSP